MHSVHPNFTYDLWADKISQTLQFELPVIQSAVSRNGRWESTIKKSSTASCHLQTCCVYIWIKNPEFWLGLMSQAFSSDFNVFRFRSSNSLLLSTKVRCYLILLHIIQFSILKLTHDQLKGLIKNFHKLSCWLFNRWVHILQLDHGEHNSENAMNYDCVKYLLSACIHTSWLLILSHLSIHNSG